jgi:formylglycine-generating enzyme required for sulfatase activity
MSLPTARSEDVLPRLFISHSSKDSIEGLAFQRWLETKGWSKDDVFIDLHNMQAGERWRDTLVKANAACEVLLYLASPDALDSEECRREVRRAEDDRKDVLVAILRDVTLDDPRLAGYADRQIMDLSTNPREERVEVEHRGQHHLVDFNRAALNAIHAKLIDWGIAPDSFEWPPRHDPKAVPYRGLDAFDEHSAGIFFGREADIMAGIRDLRQIRHRGSPRLLVIQAASGAGKSSMLRAGLWPRLGRTAEFVPLAVLRPATGIVTGRDGLGQGLAEWFRQRRRPVAPGNIHAALMRGDATAGAAALGKYLTQVVALVAEEGALGQSWRQSEGETADTARAKRSLLIAIDQGEELFAAEDAVESERFLDMLGRLLESPPDGLDPYVLVTIRADSVDALLQKVPALGIDTPHTIMLPPLSPAAYRDVIAKPAAVYSRQVQRLDLDPELIEALIMEATGADALPLLAFTLERLFTGYAPEQRLTLAHYQALGGIGGSIDRKLAEAEAKGARAGSDDSLRRLIVPGLATWDPAANAARRLVARAADVAGGDRATLEPLANALVEARLLTRGAETLEVAHEALLRREPISRWLEEQKDGLRLRDNVLHEAEQWAEAGRHADGLVRRGERLQAALVLAVNEDFRAALAPASNYLKACRKLECSARNRAWWTQAAIYTLLLAVIGGLLARTYERDLRSLAYWGTTFRGHQLAAADVARLKPGDVFSECVRIFSDDRQDGKKISKHCPDMLVIPAGSYKRGGEIHSRVITIDKPIAVSRFTITFDQWDACVAGGGCENNTSPSDRTWGRGTRPVIYVHWRDAQDYVAWLNRMTGTDSYRLLSDAEWEYAARGLTSAQAPHSEYPWGNDIGKGNANCSGCGSQWDAKQTAPVGSFKSNAFGLYDMHGNVSQWVEDCFAENLSAAPTDGSAWKKSCTDTTSSRAIRGGSWGMYPETLRSSDRWGTEPAVRDVGIGFRIARVLFPARTLLPP